MGFLYHNFWVLGWFPRSVAPSTRFERVVKTRRFHIFLLFSWAFAHSFRVPDRFWRHHDPWYTIWLRRENLLFSHILAVFVGYYTHSRPISTALWPPIHDLSASWKLFVLPYFGRFRGRTQFWGSVPILSATWLPVHDLRVSWKLVVFAYFWYFREL